MNTWIILWLSVGIAIVYTVGSWIIFDDSSRFVNGDEP